MFSLIITMIAISLVALLAGATAYFGGAAFTEGGARSEVARYTNGAQQVHASVALYTSEFQTQPGTVQDLVDAQYLSEEPWPKGAWQFTDKFVETPGHMAQAPCEALMKRVSDGTISETRQDGFHEQCYGSEAPYTYAYFGGAVGGGVAGEEKAQEPTQEPQVTGDQWAFSMGSSSLNEKINSTIAISDGYLSVGIKGYGGIGSAGWIVKTNFDGSIAWSKYLDSDAYDGFGDITRVDNGYFVVGSTYGAHSTGMYGSNGWLAKFSSDNNLIFSRAVGGADTESLTSVIQVADGVVAAGSTRSSGNGGYDAWIIKVDNNGDTIWSKTLGGTNEDKFDSVIPLSDGYLAAGHTKSHLSNWNRILLAKFSPSGDLAWTKVMHFGGSAWFGKVSAIPEGFLMAGQAVISGSSFDGVVVKIDQNGNLIWSRTFGSTDGGDSFLDVTPAAGGYVAVGNNYTSLSSTLYKIRGSNTLNTLDVVSMSWE